MNHSMNKVPPITWSFWVMKICATTLGETAGDQLSMTMKLGYEVSSIILLGFFVVTLGLQLAVKRYIPPLYWLVILSTSTAGTTMSDYMDRTLNLGYTLGSTILLTTLCIIFVVWRIATGSLAVDKIKTFRAELLYWLAILVSNTLGTALGDFLAHDSRLGFAGGAELIGGLLAVTLCVMLFTNVSRVFLFWVAFVLTRPFGATMGDVLTKTHEDGGLNLGTFGSSAVLGGVLLVLVLWVTVRQERSAPLVAP
jgi:uncharacterized membrane-anchored protein